MMKKTRRGLEPILNEQKTKQGRQKSQEERENNVENESTKRKQMMLLPADQERASHGEEQRGEDWSQY